MPTINDVLVEWLDSVKQSRADKTYRTYKSTSIFFKRVLTHHGVDPNGSLIETLEERSISWLISELNSLSVQTEKLRVIAIRQFFKFCISEYDIDLKMPKVESLVKQRGRRAGKRIAKFNREGIDTVLAGIQSMRYPKDSLDRLILLRDRAFIVTLADTGLRVHEACALRRKEIDWNKRRAVLIGKGNKEAVIRFKKRTLDLIKSYLDARAKLDGQTGTPLSDLAVFARHDDGAGDKILPINTGTGRNIVKDRVIQILGSAEPKITPHSFRHYFITRIYEQTGDLYIAQSMARHENIDTTGRYAHLSDNRLDKIYDKAMDEK